MKSVKNDALRAYEYFTDYFRQNPDSSITQAIRTANKHDIPLLKPVAIECRRRVRQGKDLVKIIVIQDDPPQAIPGVDLPTFPKPEWSQPKLVQEEEEPMAATPQDAPPESTEPKEPEEASSTAAKKAFINELLEKDPGMRPAIIQGRVQEKFEVGINPTYLYEVCRMARELHGLPQIPTRHDPNGRLTGTSPPMLPTPIPTPVQAAPVDPVTDAVKSLISALKASGMVFENITLSINSSWEAEFTYERKVSGSGKVSL